MSDRSSICFVKVGKEEVAAVDPEDFDRVNAHSWYLSSGYAVTNIDGKSMPMHRLVMDAPRGSILTTPIEFG